MSLKQLQNTLTFFCPLLHVTSFVFLREVHFDVNNNELTGDISNLIGNLTLLGMFSSSYRFSSSLPWVLVATLETHRFHNVLCLLFLSNRVEILKLSSTEIEFPPNLNMLKSLSEHDFL